MAKGDIEQCLLTDFYRYFTASDAERGSAARQQGGINNPIGFGARDTNTLTGIKSAIPYWENFQTFLGENNFDVFNNKLKSKTGNTQFKVEQFLSLTNVQLSSLVPYLRIYKVVYDDYKKGLNPVDVEFPFDHVMTEEDITKLTKDVYARGSGVGIQSFSWEDDGNTTATANKIWTAKLTMLFQDIDSLAKKWDRDITYGPNNTTKTVPLSFLDLISLPKPVASTLPPNESNRWNDNYYKIKVEIGWAPPTQKMAKELFVQPAPPPGAGSTGTNSPLNIEDILKITRKVYYLNLTTHELSFEEDGRIKLSVDYILDAGSIISSPSDSNVLTVETNTSNFRFQLPATGATGAAGAAGAAGAWVGPKELEQKRKDLLSKCDAYEKGPTPSLETEIKDLNREYRYILTKLQFERYRFFLKKVYGSGFESDKISKNLGLSTNVRLARFSKALYDKYADSTASNLPPPSFFANDIASQNPVINYGPAANPYTDRGQAVANSNLTDAQKFTLTEGKKIEAAVSREERRRLEQFGNNEEDRGFWGALFSGNDESTYPFDNIENQDIPANLPFGYATEYVYVTYVNLGSIINAALEAFYTPDNPDGIRTMVGHIEAVFANRTEGQGVGYPDKSKEPGIEELVNIADFPISMAHFVRWFFETCIKREMREWRFSSFINSLGREFFRTLVEPVCSEREEMDIQKDLSIETTIFQEPYIAAGTEPFARKNPLPPANPQDAKPFNKGPIEDGGSSFHWYVKTTDFQDFTNILGDASKSGVLNYLFIHGNSDDNAATAPLAGGTPPNSDTRREQGIYDFYIGRSDGVIKSISFTKNDVPFLKESRLEASTREGGSTAILARELYNAEVTMVGNNFWHPGMMIYINLINFSAAAAPTTANKPNPATANKPNPATANKPNPAISAASYLGLEGYYRVIKTSHSFESGKFESKLTLIFEFSGYEKMNPPKFNRNDISFICREIRGKTG